MAVMLITDEVLTCPNPLCGGHEVHYYTGSGLKKGTYDGKKHEIERVTPARAHVAPPRQSVNAYCANQKCGAVFILAHWKKDAKQVPDEALTRRLLQEVASSGADCITYKGLSTLYRRVTGMEIHPHNCWDKVLGLIAADCIKKKEGILSVLVVNGTTKLPGKSFFWHAIGPGASDYEMWRKAASRCRRYWYNRRWRPWKIKTMAEQQALREAHVEKYGATA